MHARPSQVWLRPTASGLVPRWSEGAKTFVSIRRAVISSPLPIIRQPFIVPKIFNIFGFDEGRVGHVRTLSRLVGRRSFRLPNGGFEHRRLLLKNPHLFRCRTKDHLVTAGLKRRGRSRESRDPTRGCVNFGTPGCFGHSATPEPSRRFITKQIKNRVNIVKARERGDNELFITLVPKVLQ